MKSLELIIFKKLFSIQTVKYNVFVCVLYYRTSQYLQNYQLKEALFLPPEDKDL